MRGLGGAEEEEQRATRRTEATIGPPAPTTTNIGVRTLRHRPTSGVFKVKKRIFSGLKSRLMHTDNHPAAENRCRGSSRAETQTHQEERKSAELQPPMQQRLRGGSHPVPGSQFTVATARSPTLHVLERSRSKVWGRSGVMQAVSGRTP